MKKNLLMIIAAAAFVIIIGGVFFFFGNEKQAGKNNKAGTAPKTGIEVKSRKLIDWLKLGKGIECVISAPEGNIVVKTKNNNVRIEGIPYAFSQSADENLSEGVSLTVGDMMYMWSGSEGTKMNIKEMEEMTDEESAGSNEASQKTWEESIQGWQEAGINYTCAEKKIDNSLFEPPKNVEFNDMTAMMRNMKEMSDKMMEGMETGEIPDMEDMQRQLEDMQNNEDMQKKMDQFQGAN